MGEYIFVFASLTSANRVKAYIKREKGRDVYITQIPKSDKIKGCSYGIYVNKDEIYDIKTATEAMGINTRGVFHKTELEG